jgi:hypothetical protein
LSPQKQRPEHKETDQRLVELFVIDFHNVRSSLEPRGAVVVFHSWLSALLPVHLSFFRRWIMPNLLIVRAVIFAGELENRQPLDRKEIDIGAECPYTKHQ